MPLLAGLLFAVFGAVAADHAEVEVRGGSAAEARPILDVVVSSWDRYLHQDSAAYAALLTPDVRRMSQRSGRVQDGSAAVVAALPAEWAAFERPNGVIAERMTLRRVRVELDGTGEPSTALVTYAVEVEGGARWTYSDQGFVLQLLERRQGRWLLAHHTDAWALDYDIDTSAPGERTFGFTFVQPVTDLDRAARFYGELLGAPAGRGRDHASFSIAGQTLLLQRGALDGVAALEKGLPGGYAVFDVDDVEAAGDRVLRHGGRREDVEVPAPGDDTLAAFRDTEGNLLVLAERSYEVAEAEAPPEPKGLEGTGMCAAAAGKAARAWLRRDGAGLAQLHGGGSWFDDTVTRTRGPVAAPGLVRALEADWRSLDHGPSGVLATLEAASLHRRAAGAREVVSYERTLRGTGPHPFRVRGFVTHVCQAGHIRATVQAIQDRSEAPVIQLDYAAYPVRDLQRATRFYRDALGLGRPYEDEDWRGFWSNGPVFGLYVADPDADGLPRPGRASGYMSFWVRSARETRRWLASRGSSFPVVPAINEQSGLDAEPGYLQVYATDSEGSGAVFTEYTGRPR